VARPARVVIVLRQVCIIPSKKEGGDWGFFSDGESVRVPARKEVLLLSFRGVWAVPVKLTFRRAKKKMERVICGSSLPIRF